MAEQAISTADKIKLLENKLEQRLSDKKLSFIALDSEIEEIFTLGSEDFTKITSSKLSEYSFIISRYGLYLNKELNKEKAARNWAKKSLDYIILPIMSNYRNKNEYMSNDEVKMRAIFDNDVAKKFYAYIIDKEQTIDLLIDLSFDIRKMSDSLTEMSKSRRYTNG